MDEKPISITTPFQSLPGSKDDDQFLLNSVIYRQKEERSITDIYIYKYNLFFLHIMEDTKLISKILV